MDSIAAIIIALGGGTGLGAVISSIFSYRKYKAEADKMQVENYQTEMTYITNALKDINEETKRQFEDFKKSHKEEMDALKKSHKAEIDELKEANHNLTKKVDKMSQRLTSLMTWVTIDDARYRSWLENRLQELDPTIEFPDLPDPPDVYDDNDDEDDE